MVPPPTSRSESPPDKLQASGPLRRLLPASAASSASAAAAAGSSANTPAAGSGSDPGSPSTSTAGPPRKKRRQTATAACGACRKRKSRCDGDRPTCSICRERGTPCEYDTKETETHTQALKRKYTELQTQKSVFEQVYEVLQTRPEKDAVEVFQRIRRGTDAGSVLRHVNHGDILIQLALVPEARYRYEFPYLPDMPSFLRQSSNPYLDSDVYEYSLRGTPDPAPQQAHQQPQQAPRDGPERDPYLKPYLSATVVDPWLDSVQPSKWTTVSCDDSLMRKVLHDYFLFEYDWFTYFHKDYFLEDMATENKRFCSSLLANAVLCVGCFCHRGLQGRAEFWNPRNLGYQFLAEAKRLFELGCEEERPFKHPNDLDWERKNREWEQGRLTTIQAAQLLNLVYNLNGSDKIGWRYTLRAIEMAHEIQLMRPPQDRHTPEMQCVRAYTAWGLFCWQSLGCYHYLKPPPLIEPPDIPLPDPLQQPQWYGELWVRYPLNQSRLSTCHGLLFKAKADFWTIINELASFTFSPNGSPSKLAVNHVSKFYYKLKAWMHDLPEPLTPKKIVFPQQLKLHMHYHHMLIDLVTPFIDYPSRAGSAQTPREIHTQAVTHFETLMRLYYLRHGFEATDSFLLHFLGLLNYMTMTAIESSAASEQPSAGKAATSSSSSSTTTPSLLEARRSSLLLLTKGIHDQSRVHFVARAILRMQVCSMRPEDVELLRQFVEIETDRLIYGPLEQAVHTDWPVYEVGLEAKAEQRRQGRMLASRLASLELEPGPVAAAAAAGQEGVS
ncbi:hypothetical protein C8A05DRAFT_46654 [Staphylotrichum tortipilum]|uniref:Zn(2)-C6 fungal-type domain-containing protein n=1 Tax=Staphylotrichum tortipilum TaxID=2831512 RepID=A0AAN6MFX7_9PEZI|nr:hypothetical protein C8A05DRAFT_46654 [Staphylotrichum longicolle]